MKVGDTYHVDKGQSVFACSFIMRIKRIRHDTIFFDRIVFPKSGKIYYDVRTYLPLVAFLISGKKKNFQEKDGTY